MKRSGPLRRRTPLARSTTPLRRTRLRPRSDAYTEDQTREAVAYDTVRRRAGGRCEIGADGCTGGHDQTHHRLPRSASSVRNMGRHDPALLLAACGWCHDWVETHRAEAMAAGWLVSRYDRR